jgi:oligopeptide/dipeptide ABC transporter ATP-binding protein
VPSPFDLPPGCPFAGRCPIAEDRCHAEQPPLLVRDDGHRVACWLVD